MPPSRTPLRAPARPNARSQFASTPRFLLSQRAVASQKGAKYDDRLLSEDDADPFSFSDSRPSKTDARDQHSRQKEVIEDSIDELDEQRDLHQRPVNGLRDEDISSSSPVDAELDTELEALFGPTKHRTKRRRVSVNIATPATQKRKSRQDMIVSPGGSPEPSISAVDPSSPSLPYRITPQKTPRPPATPATHKQSIRAHPRFLVSSISHLPPISQSQPRIRPTAATPGSTRKPAFVLPRSPSPSQSDDANTIPTPFSPSSHALRRRGRQRSSAPSYLLGGMAAEVRSWILEMGSKREQQLQATRAETGAFQRYPLVICISEVRQSALGSCGPLAFIQGQTVPLSEHGESNDNGDTSQRTRNVLLLGAPRARAGELRMRASSPRVPELQAGDVVGVCRGLIWEVGADYDHRSDEPDYEGILRSESENSPGLGRWTVGMEWEVISSA